MMTATIHSETIRAVLPLSSATPCFFDADEFAVLPAAHVTDGLLFRQFKAWLVGPCRLVAPVRWRGPDYGTALRTFARIDPTWREMGLRPALGLIYCSALPSPLVYAVCVTDDADGIRAHLIEVVSGAVVHVAASVWRGAYLCHF